MKSGAIIEERAGLAMFMQGTHKERPLTQDLLAHVLRALGAKIDR
jgi:hypothetical protein